MFGAPSPPLTKSELKEQEQEASITVQRFIFRSILLYLSPFAIDAVMKLTYGRASYT